MERSLPDPRHAFRNELALMKRQIRQTRSRQGWPGKVQQTPLSTLESTTRLAFDDAGYSTAAILALEAGAWTLIARASFNVDNGGGGFVYYTGKEKAVTRLITAGGELIDFLIAESSATPKPSYGGGYHSLPVMLFGLVTLNDPTEIRLQVQAVDPDGVTPCAWHHKMMATPV